MAAPMDGRARSPVVRDGLARNRSPPVAGAAWVRTGQLGVVAPAAARSECSGGSAKWQATDWPGVLASSGGSVVAQMSAAFQHRVRNRHPDGGLIGLGRSPASRIRAFGGAPRATRGSGTAESSACVYGCRGAL